MGKVHNYDQDDKTGPGQDEIEPIHYPLGWVPGSPTGTHTRTHVSTLVPEEGPKGCPVEWTRVNHLICDRWLC